MSERKGAEFGPVTTTDQVRPNAEFVHWNGPEDPDNPRNWSTADKNHQVIIVGLFTLFANLANSIFTPGIGQLITEFHVTDPSLKTLSMTIEVLGAVLGPLVLAPLSEHYGRLIIYHICTVTYVAFLLGSALSTGIGMFIFFRVMCGFAAAGPMSIGGGTVADLIPQEKRGRAMALFFSGSLFGSLIGPASGGFVCEYMGWRWTFRVCLILSGILGIVSFAILRETNAEVLLERKARRLRRETGNANLATKLSSSGLKLTPSQMLRRAIVRPTKLLIFSPIVLLLALYCGLVFGLMFFFLTTFQTVYMGIYHLGPGVAGLAYTGLGLGQLVGLMLFGVLSDKLLKQHQKMHQDSVNSDNASEANKPVAKPEIRLIMMKWFAPITPLGFFVYGWGAQYHTHILIPILGTAIIGLSTFYIVLPSVVYLVDMFGPQAAASALAANMIVRSACGALLPLSAPAVYKFGLGWGNSILGLCCLAFTPVPWLFSRYGEYLRTRFLVEF